MFVRGIASTSRIDKDGTILAPGCFFLSIAATGLNGIALNIDHDPGKRAGRITRLDYEDEVLLCEAELDPTLAGVRQIIERMKRGSGFGFSVGGRKKRFGVNSELVTVIHSAVLDHIAITEWPRNADCRIEQVIPARPRSPVARDALADMFQNHPKPTFRMPSIRYGDA